MIEAIINFFKKHKKHKHSYKVLYEDRYDVFLNEQIYEPTRSCFYYCEECGTYFKRETTNNRLYPHRYYLKLSDQKKDILEAKIKSKQFYFK